MEWTNVEDSLPNTEGEYLCFIVTESGHTCGIEIQEYSAMFDGEQPSFSPSVYLSCGTLRRMVAYWMKLPDNPKV